MATPADRGWGNPGRKHGDAQATEYGRRHITTITTSDGSKFAVRKELEHVFLGFLNEIIARGYRIKGEVLDDWGWFVRLIAGTDVLTNHAWGLAIDVNAMTNPQGRVLRTDMPAFVPEAAKRWGLRWGGNYTNRPDGMHFEWIGSRDEALRFVADLKTLHAAGVAIRPQLPPLVPPTVTNYPEAAVLRIDMPIDTDDEGRGYRDIDVPPKEIISVISNTANPPDSGYKPIPDVARLDVEGKSRIVVEEAVPNGRIDVTIWVA